MKGSSKKGVERRREAKAERKEEPSKASEGAILSSEKE